MRLARNVLRLYSGMAMLDGNLWEHNMALVVVVDVTDDYRLMKPPLPTECYPVLAEVWVPRFRLSDNIATVDLVDGYLYDWHESPKSEQGTWFIGVVAREFLTVDHPARA